MSRLDKISLQVNFCLMVGALVQRLINIDAWKLFAALLMGSIIAAWMHRMKEKGERS